jgi:NitT/TauT family transport system substrate-binding protein
MEDAMTITRRRLLNAAMFTPAGAIAACSSPGRTGPKAQTKVTYLTGIGTRPREEYVQVAIAKGYFQDAGLSVTVQVGAPSDANLQKIAAGKAQFATIDFVSAIHGVMTYPDKYRIVAAIQRRTLIAFIALAGRGMTRPGDLVGKTVGIPPGSAAQTLLPAFAKLAKFDDSTVKVYNFAPDQLPVLLAAGQIDAMSAYSIDTPTVKAADPRHQDPAVIHYADYLNNLYGTVLVADKDLCDFFPGMVKHFATGLVKGVHYAVAYPQEAGQIIKTAVPTTDLGAAVDTMKLMRADIGTGILDPTKVMQGIAELEQVRLAPSGLQPEQIVAFNLAPQVA